MPIIKPTIQHVSLHHVDTVELRIVSDMDIDTLPLVESERQVLTQLARETTWPHRTVMLSVLSDLAPLQRQLRTLRRLPSGGRIDDIDALLKQPVINVYDLAAPQNCHIFVNHSAMVAAGYWNDVLAMQGLLAHEHAHPLAECAAIDATRHLQLAVAIELTVPWATEPEWARTWAGKVNPQITTLVQSIALVGPRELFTNEIVLATGFVQPLLYLNRKNVHNLVAGLAYRPIFHKQLAEAVAVGRLSQPGADTLLLLGDLQGYLMMVMEIVAFQRQGYLAEAKELQDRLQDEIFPHLDPQFGTLFQAICNSYKELSAVASLSEMEEFVRSLLHLLSAVLEKRSAKLTYQLSTT